MSKFITWNSQPVDVWADRYAEGKAGLSVSGNVIIPDLKR